MALINGEDVTSDMVIDAIEVIRIIGVDRLEAATSLSAYLNYMKQRSK